MTHDAPASGPIRKTVTVPLDRQAAFELFTSGINRWWPKDSHSLTASRGIPGDVGVRMEPRVGGRVLERLPDGTEAAWATITHWQPGERLGLSWYVGRDEDEATTIDIRFTQTEAGTRVDLAHGGFAALGNEGRDICATYATGWDKVLCRCYRRACGRVMA